MVLLKVFNSRQEAELVKSLLESENIWAFVAADDQAGLVPATALTLGVKLMVQPEDLEKAQTLIIPVNDTPEAK